MTKHKTSSGRRAAAFVLAAAMLCGLLAGFSRAESTGVCTAAMEKCLTVGWAAGVVGGFWGVFVGAGSCILGYDFCRRYVAKEK